MFISELKIINGLLIPGWFPRVENHPQAFNNMDNYLIDAKHVMGLTHAYI